MDNPAIINGRAVSDTTIPILKPYLPRFDELESDFKRVLASGQITNGRFVREFEARTSEFLGVRHCIAVSSCTAGMMLVAKALRLSGEIIVPSFTFSATGHALKWCGLQPVFVECRPDTFNIDPEHIRSNIHEGTSGILVPHIFGNPADVDTLTQIAETQGLSLFFDAAHGFGSTSQGRHIGRFGNAEIFSLSPTKVLISGEGGLIATDDKELAEQLRIGRNYGDPGDYDCPFAGLNARMTEMGAIIGLASLEMLDENIARRTQIADQYRSELSSLPGIQFQAIETGNTSTWKDFTIRIDSDAFGLNRNRVAMALDAEGIQSRKYFYPPLHLMTAYNDGKTSKIAPMPVTEGVSENVLSLPIYYSLKDDDIDRIVEAFHRIHRHADKINSYFDKKDGIC
jgi:dTDP-4-amino-4,6-dideoxygalactose transaminase